MIKRIWVVAFKLELPNESRIHPVFHLSVLKRQIGELHSIQGELPTVDVDVGTIHPKPQAILDRRQRRGRAKVLIYWKGLSPAKATWEDTRAMQHQFLELSLEDKANF